MDSDNKFFLLSCHVHPHRGDRKICLLRACLPSRTFLIAKVPELHAGAFSIVEHMTWLEPGKRERQYASTGGATRAYHMLFGAYITPRNSYNTYADMCSRQKADNTQHSWPACRRVPATSQQGVVRVGGGATTAETVKLCLRSSPAAGGSLQSTAILQTSHTADALKTAQCHTVCLWQ